MEVSLNDSCTERLDDSRTERTNTSPHNSAESQPPQGLRTIPPFDFGVKKVSDWGDFRIVPQGTVGDLVLVQGRHCRRWIGCGVVFWMPFNSSRYELEQLVIAIRKLDRTAGKLARRAFLRGVR